MNITKAIKMLSVIEERMADNLSKDVFHARFEYLLYRDMDSFRDNILGLSELYNQQWRIFELDRMCAGREKVEGIIIFGCGINGKQAYRLIKGSGYRDYPIIFCDNDDSKQGKKIYDCDVISSQELIKNYRNWICVIGTCKYRQNIYEQLLYEGFPNTNILYPHLGVLYGATGTQYFDFFKPKENEIFVDGGGI